MGIGQDIKATLANTLLGAVGFWRAPGFELSEYQKVQFEELTRMAVDSGSGGGIDYGLDPPKAAYLQWLAANRDPMFHGSKRPSLSLLGVNRESSDLGEFGNQRAVYGSSDPIWAMYFAVLNRATPTFRGTHNGCLVVKSPVRSYPPRYFFAVNEEAVNESLWSAGWMYILPKMGFESDQMVGGVIDTAHWISRDPVKPLAVLQVDPGDFPFKDNVIPRKLSDPHYQTYLKLRRALR